MTYILVLYYSMYGHVELLAEGVAEVARSVGGTKADIMGRRRSSAKTGSLN